MAFILQRPKIVLFGDSLTERGWAPGGWAGRLADTYTRRFDIVNRGFGGYNTRWALGIMRDLFSEFTPQSPPRLVTLFFGANDAARPEGPSVKQHVPVTEYKTNLKSIIKYIQKERGVTNVLLITPPPVFDEGRFEWRVVKFGAEEAAKMGKEIDRTNEYTKQYAEACKQVAQELGLPVVDLYTQLQEEENWQRRFMIDGLHFTPEGQGAVYEQVWKVLEASFPDLRVDTPLPLHMPAWDAIDADEPQNTFALFEGMRGKRTSKEDTPSAKKRKADAGKGGDEEDAKQQ